MRRCEGTEFVVVAGAGFGAFCRGMALAYSGLFFGFCFVVPALIGFACWLKNPLSLAELRKGISKPLGKL